ncbi:MAG: hypothetical protein MJ071_00380 [Oscillospiraceae bacterium]|nr:hypothetical protein [Oscillospiraceae bacterium]
MIHSNWNCPQCHNQNISGNLIKCPKCGKKRNRWGYWDCKYCGNKSIRGDHKECAQCGHARDRDVKFYLRDDLIEFVDEVSGESAVRIGRQNWICPYCNQQNDDEVQTCIYCSAPRSESKERYHDVGNATPPKPEFPTKKKFTLGKLTPTKCCYLMFAVPFVLLVLLGIVYGIIDAVAYRRIRTADLDKAIWQTVVQVEQMEVRKDNDWEMPSYARLITTKEEDYTYVDHYETRSREVWVDDYDDDDYGWDDGGWDDYGDGQFGMFRVPLNVCMASPAPQIVPLHYETEYYDVPVYATRKRTKYYYEYDYWFESRQITETGEHGEEPFYGELDLTENERESDRYVEYYVNFSYKDKAYSVTVSQEEWDRIAEQRQVYFRIKDFTSSNQIIEFVEGKE